MKKIYIITFTILNTFSYAQKNVGINQVDPKAALDISIMETSPEVKFDVKKVYPSVLKITNKENTIVLINKKSPGATVSVRTFNKENNNSIFSIEDKDSPNIFLRYYDNMKNGDFSPSNLGGKGIVFSTDGNNGGLYIGTLSDRNGGIYIGKDGNNGIGLKRKPTTKLDIANNLVFIPPFKGALTAKENEKCDNPGEIRATTTSFYGCTKSGWKKFNN
ncbi:hypothetical protein MWN41_04110 [Ornithobacterium rhinotracheale]|uniref:hypothetical protein n=1 Tax=Ornithobacterium rhinotracheale TaxID=28251 RepID=UPI001FF13FAD|nr:hypothetical protein [Ornithobacterium rhinotracheale]MCK0202202.1 hypothetical protein [Ornithobacterium rhinotracheale]